MRAASLRRRGQTILLATALLSCTAEGPTTVISDGGTVASVLVIGVPTTPLMVGNEVQLAATALNETGSTLSNRAITWKSSDATIATVSNSGRVTAVGAGMVTITATSGGKEGTATLDLRDGGLLGTAGGTLTMLGGKAVLTIPKYALTQSTTFMLAPATTTPASDRLVAKTAYELVPEALTFGYYGSATLTLSYDKANVPTGIPVSSLQLYRLTADTWEQVRGSTVDTTLKKVTGTIGVTGIYAVMSTPVDHLTLSAGSGSALFVGQTTTLTVKTYDTLNTLLTGRVVQWNSSAPARATVNGEGLVTALSVGTTTITATSEGKSASTTISILAPPTADWSQVTEWTTYQGNAKHTGYVPVTANAASFHELWVTTPFASGAVNPVTTGNGRVYVSSSSYFAGQWGAALNATTGAKLWSKDFGGIHGVHPPANANGVMYVTTSGHGDSYLWAFDGATGAEKFHTAYGNQWSTYYAPVIVDDAVYMAGGYYDGVYSFNATTGTQRWFGSTSQYDQWTPAVDAGLVYTYTGSYAPKVSVKDAATGTQVYEIADPSFEWTGWSMGLAPVLGSSSNLLATNGGRLISFNLTARTIGWTQPGTFRGSVTVANGFLYVANATGVDVRNESDGSLVGPWVPPEGQVMGPVIVTKNLLFASTAANTYAVDLATRKQIWSYPAGGALAISSAGTLFIAQSNGKLAAIALK